MNKAKTWLVVANMEMAFIYDFTDQQNTAALRDHLVKSFDFPKGGLKNSELKTDEPGRYQSMGAPSSGYEPDTSPHQVELVHFSRLIAEYLLAEKLAHHYEHLILCAEPHFIGILDAHLPKQVKESVTKRLHKDYIHLINNSFNEFSDRIRDNLL